MLLKLLSFSIKASRSWLCPFLRVCKFFTCFYRREGALPGITHKKNSAAHLQGETQALKRHGTKKGTENTYMYVRTTGV